MKLIAIILTALAVTAIASPVNVQEDSFTLVEKSFTTMIHTSCVPFKGCKRKATKLGYGCHKGYCWSYCGLSWTSGEWCYTTKAHSKYYSTCEHDFDCLGGF